MSIVDQFYRSFVIQKFFSRGWGSPENVKRLFEFRKVMANRETCLKLVDPDHKITIDKVHLDESSECKLIDGHFRSPFANHLPGLLPEVAENAYFQLVVPAERPTGADQPICIHMAGTGDQGFWRRRSLIARPLLKDHGISSLILENPFYGSRKPEEQFRSSLLNVSDIFVMGGSLILEGITILRWCEREGYSPCVLHGISMGGHMASLAAAAWDKPVGLVPCLSWSTASGVFTQGVMSGAIDWKSLENQFFATKFFKDELYKLVWSDNDIAYQAGKNFVSQYKLNNSSENEKPKVDTISSGGGSEQGPDKSLFQALTNFLRERGLLKSLPDVNGSSTSKTSNGENGNGPTTQKDAKQTDFTTGLIGKSKSKVQSEAIQFMRGVMDEFTHLKNFPQPIDPSMIIVVAARDDAYVPRDGYQSPQEIWPGCEVRFLDCGHISAYLLHQDIFKKAIAEAVDLHRAKYNSNGSLKVEVESSEPEPDSATDKKLTDVLGFQSSKKSSSDSSKRV